MKRVLKIMLLINILFTICLGSYVFAANVTSSKKITSTVNSVNDITEEENLEVQGEQEQKSQVENVETGNEQKEEKQDNNKGIAMIAAALSTGLACIGSGIAVALVASSAVGAISENPSLLGKTIIFAGLAEGIAIYGLIISIMILNQA